MTIWSDRCSFNVNWPWRAIAYLRYNRPDKNSQVAKPKQRRNPDNWDLTGPSIQEQNLPHPIHSICGTFPSIPDARSWGLSDWEKNGPTNHNLGFQVPAFPSVDRWGSSGQGWARRRRWWPSVASGLLRKEKKRKGNVAGVVTIFPE